MTAEGHEERFLPPRLSAGSGFRKETIAGMRHKGRDRRERPFVEIAGSKVSLLRMTINIIPPAFLYVVARIVPAGQR